MPYLPARPDEAVTSWLQLADHPDWERREAAATMLSELLLTDFETFYPKCLAWVHHLSENVRRAVVVGMKVAAKARVPAWGENFLDLIDPLMSDRSLYVRKNLGPFAIGDGLLRYYPQLTLQRLATWAKQPDPQTRWNVAMAFSAAEGAKHVDVALPILSALATDERRFVWRAVASAMRNLGRRRPEQVRPVLEEWLHDEQRRRAAEVAMRYFEQAVPAETNSIQKRGQGGLNSAAVEDLLKTSEEIMRAHPGQVFDSAETLHQMREERLKDLEQ